MSFPATFLSPAEAAAAHRFQGYWLRCGKMPWRPVNREQWEAVTGPESADTTDFIVTITPTGGEPMTVEGQTWAPEP